jgi:PAS domain S-box-containing protein
MKSWYRRLTKYWKHSPIEQRGTIAVCIPLTCLIATAIASTLFRQRMVVAQAYVDHTNQVLATSQGSLISLLNAETGVRGYFIAKEPIFLESYDLALKTINPALTNLERLVSENPPQQQQAQLLKQIAAERMQLLQDSVRRVEANDIVTPVLTVKRLLNGKRTMDRFRQVIGQFEAQEKRRLSIHTRSLQEQQQLNSDATSWGTVLGIIGTLIAVRLLQELATELREREVRLRESRSLIEAIVANVVDGVMIIDDRGRVESFNNAAVAMFGYQPHEVIGWNWQQLLDLVAQDNQKLLGDRSTSPTDRLLLGHIWQAIGQRKNGDLFPIEISMNPIAYDDDRIAIVRDITERQQAAATLQSKAMELSALNDSLQDRNESLRQSNRELDRFAYITAHDLKAPLRAIASLSEWIEEDLDEQLTTETRSQMQLLRRRVYRMQALLNSLLEYSRAGRIPTPVATVGVGQLLDKIVQHLSPPDTFSIKIISPMPVMTTRWQPLEQVFTHLIDNSIRHHPTKIGIVEVSAIDLGDRYEFAIADNGDGIEPQYHSRIYTIFQTLKARDLHENIGAGLAIVQKIVTAEGGTIQLESMPGKGATFRFTWLKEPNTIKDNATPPGRRYESEC